MNTIKYQSGILKELPKSAIYLFFRLTHKNKLKQVLQSLLQLVDGDSTILGLGGKVMALLQVNTPYHPYTPTLKAQKLTPKADCDLVLWLRDNDQGVLTHSARRFIKILQDAFVCSDIARACTYLTHEQNGKLVNHDLSGFEDGTENPQGDDQFNTAIIQSDDKFIDGSSCWVIQKWLHDFDWLDKASQHAKEELIGRSLDDNREFENNKPLAHIKRTAQESFEPEAFMWRRSMPWINDQLNGGLIFSCFAQDFYPFEVQFARMIGEEDGIIDGLFKFSKIISTQFLWCPPFVKGKLILPDLVG
ncbi:Dyp-type peroxidase [Fastidiosibacter lacustris]|uniref:Dyp-type peroxidase n=1 Tax=Fastidiosibacter lacustris TaxID=2056695 RepID=UPI000E34C8B2|nr:Dyp-type peroxidase [Fastidiosibacter lacustris]